MGSPGPKKKKKRKIHRRNKRIGSVGLVCGTDISEVARELASSKAAGDGRLATSVTKPGATPAVRGRSSGVRASAGFTATKPPPAIPTTIADAIAIGAAGWRALAAEFGLGLVMT